jgi:hypothetical protein
MEMEQRKAMENRFLTSEMQHKKTTQQLEKAEMLNRDLVESLSLFEVQSHRLSSLGTSSRDSYTF